MTVILPLQLLSVLMLWITYSDIRYRRISNIVCAAVFSLSLTLAFSQHQLADGIISSIIMFLISLLLFYFNIVAAGDGKLASAFAVALSPQQLISALYFTLLFGGVVAVIYLIKYQLIQRRSPEKARGLPYGVAIACGFGLQIFASYL